MDYTFDVIPGTAVYPLVMEHMPQIVERVRAAYEAHHRQQTRIPHSPFLRFPHHPRARSISAPASLGEPFNVAGLAEDMLRVCDVTVIATTAATPHIHTADMLAYNPLFLHICLRDLAPGLIVQDQNIVDDVDHVLQAQTSVHLAAQTMGHERFITGTLGAVLAGTGQVTDAASPDLLPLWAGHPRPKSKCMRLAQ